ncbi:ABC transporter permease [Mycobacterium sp. ACS4331]|uniref:ABC transporter permease n=1 Tax=Mycobacterium sp. ACS4331 TaxID=1834121 RepID=UPI001E2F4D23|nr:ABC transporter permease [Mycobacterium sp. ACS4331]
MIPQPEPPAPPPHTAPTDATTDAPAALAAVQELRTLADVVRNVDAAAAAAEWDDHGQLSALAAQADADLLTLYQTEDIATSGASPLWQARLEDQARASAAARTLTATPREAAANAVAAVALARAAVAEAVRTTAQARGVALGDAGPATVARRDAARAFPALLDRLGRMVADELRHIVADRPRAIALRIAITLGLALSLVAFYHLTGFSRYDAGRLTLYLFSAVVGSVVCTNALCFEAQRVRDALVSGESLWRILVAKNLAMAALVVLAGLPVIALLTIIGDGNAIAMVDQLLTMVFIWLGVGNVLSVLYPLRHEPISARLRDGTWKPYLLSFAVSYGVGLTVNLMIYWRLWSKQTASQHLAGGAWAAFVLVLASALVSWLLLTVLAVACSREHRQRRLLSREMVAYRR